jgi:hypothetical protein
VAEAGHDRNFGAPSFLWKPRFNLLACFQGPCLLRVIDV